MTALALTIAIFGFWSVVGFALVSALYGRSNLVRRALLAPITGAAATALLLVSLNWEIPVRYAGPAATVLLLALTAWLLRTNRVSFRLREMAPFIAVLIVATLVTGYPMLRFGFDWVSHDNEDIGDYCLEAKLLLNHGNF